MRRQELLGSRYPKRRKDVIWKEVASEGVLLDLRSGAYFEAGAVGLAIWKECNGTKSLETIGRSVVRKFGAAPRRALTDAADFVSALARHGLADLLERPAG